jgi:carbon storage regulator
MLVLTRKKNERIHIGDGITVVVIEVRGKYVRLGIEANPWQRILRGELLPPTGGEGKR